MAEKPTYEELEQRVKELEKETIDLEKSDGLLREERDKAQRYLDIAGVILVSINKKGEVTLINQKGCEVLGYNEEEIVGKNWFENFIPEWLKKDLIPVSKKLLNGELEFVEYHKNPILTKTGEERIILWHNTNLKDAEGNIIGHLSSGEDITDREQAEEALRASEERYRNLYEEAPLGYLEFDTEGRITNVNKKQLEMGDYTKEEMVGQFLWNFAVEKEEARKTITAKLSGNMTPSKGLERNYRRKDGSTFPVLIDDFLVKDESGRIIGARSLIRDIADTKQAEEALRKSEERFCALFEQASIGIAEVETKTGRFIRINQKYGDITGYSIEEMMAMTYVQITHPDDLHIDQENLKKIAEGEISIYSMQKRYIRKNGEIVWVNLTASPIWENGNQSKNHITVAEDITERKRMEEELLRAQKLESVGMLAGGIAHDFNNILTIILGNVSLAKMQAKPEDKIFDLLSGAETGSARAQMLTRQLLTFAKGGVPVKETASIKDILKESSLFVLRGSKSSCEFSIAEDLWPSEVDVGQISQVINNIVINANQAMPEGGILQVAADNLIIEGRHGLPVKTGRYIRISVIDQGVGIAEKHLSKIFDPYFTTKQEGSGLGLATSYSIIKNHDGYITVESQLSVGTTFYIYLPASDKAVPEKEKVRLIKGHGRILVMDDEASLRKIVGRMLGELGYESEFAKDGAEAIRMVKEAKESGKPYDAVILDLTIPGGMGGKEAINKLLEIDPELKAIVSSGYSDDPVLANFQDYGFKGMMPKPFESLSLGKVLHEVLKGEKE